MLLNSILYSSRIILFILKIFFDDSNTSLLTFRKTFDTNLLQSSNIYYDLIEFNNFINNNFTLYFDNIEIDSFNFILIDKFYNNLSLNMTLINNAIESLEFSKIKLYLSSFYNIILLFEKFEVDGNNLNIDSNEFLDQAQNIFDNYDSFSTTILEKTENKLDLTLVFVLYVYYLSSNVLFCCHC